MQNFNTEKIIKTKNLQLEPINIGHAKKLFEELQSIQLYTFIPHDPPESISRLEKRYQIWSERGSTDGNEIWLNYAIFRPLDQTYLGTLQSTIQLQGQTYIAYEVFPAYWQQGIAKEACIGLITYLFEQFDVKKVTAHIDTRNIASIRLIEALNFKLTETIKNADEFKGKSSDEFVYELNISDN